MNFRAKKTGEESNLFLLPFFTVSHLSFVRLFFSFNFPTFISDVTVIAGVVPTGPLQIYFCVKSKFACT